MKTKFNLRQLVYIAAYLCGVLFFALSTNYNCLTDENFFTRSVVLLVVAHCCVIVCATVASTQNAQEICKTFAVYVLLSGIITLFGEPLQSMVGNFVLFVITGCYHATLIKGSELFPKPTDFELDPKKERRYAHVEIEKYGLVFMIDIILWVFLFIS